MHKPGRSHRQLLIVGFKSLEKGQEFQNWPLHVVVVPWFQSVKQTQLNAEIMAIAERTKPLHVEIGERALLGASKDVPIRRIVGCPPLSKLHLTTLGAVHDSKGVLEDFSHVSYMYHPYVATPNDEVLDGEYTLSSLALIDDIGNQHRRVTEVYDLHG